MKLSLEHPDLTLRSGRGVKVAVIDSGIHEGNPHIGVVAGGVALDQAGQLSNDWTDRLGHGTAVAAAILEKAPNVELHAVKVFHDELVTGSSVLVKAIEWAANLSADLINLSLGTDNPKHEERLRAAVAGATKNGSLIVAAGAQKGHRWLPGSLPCVVSVQLDLDCRRDTIHLYDWHRCPSGGHPMQSAGGIRSSQPPSICASGYPRPIPGVPPERNLKGISFAVANATGFLARILESAPTTTSNMQGAARLLSALDHLMQLK